ncbi:MAG TPA: hypothetical protein VJR89_40070, partial [Polyangiales bacterium]|nr:hypothetical protein [Polyangiales bacterium]
VATQAELRSSGGSAQRLALDLHLARVADDIQELRGTLSVRGDNAAELLGVLHADGVVHWLPPAPFELNARIRLEPRALHMAAIRGRCGDVSITGHLSWSELLPNGALLFTQGERRIGLRFADGGVQPSI